MVLCALRFFILPIYFLAGAMESDVSSSLGRESDRCALRGRTTVTATVFLLCGTVAR
jgi:hypothetical protein